MREGGREWGREGGRGRRGGGEGKREGERESGRERSARYLGQHANLFSTPAHFAASAFLPLCVLHRHSGGRRAQCPPMFLRHLSGGLSGRLKSSVLVSAKHGLCPPSVWSLTQAVRYVRWCALTRQRRSRFNFRARFACIRGGHCARISE